MMSQMYSVGTADRTKAIEFGDGFTFNRYGHGSFLVRGSGLTRDQGHWTTRIAARRSDKDRYLQSSVDLMGRQD